MPEKLISIHDISANTGYSYNKIRQIAEELGISTMWLDRGEYKINYTLKEYALILNYEEDTISKMLPYREVTQINETYYVFPSRMNWDKSL